MKVIVSGSRRLFLRPRVIACAAVAVVVVTAIIVLSLGGQGDAAASAATPDIELSAAMGVDIDEGAAAVSAVLSTLENFGARDADEAVTIWAEGVAAKNGVTQYSVMSDELKEKYLDVVTEKSGGLLFPVSASQIDSWYCSEILENDDGTQLAKLRFALGEQTASAELVLTDEGDYCVVSSVAIETPLYEFTGIG